MLVAAHLRAQQRRVARHEAPDVVGAIERDRGPETELRALTQEIFGHVLAHAPKAGRPAEHADLVVVAFADDVGAGLDQHLDDLEVGGVGGEVQRVGVVAVVADAHVGAALQQQPHAGLPVAPSRHVERGPSPEISAAGVDQVGMGVEQAAELVGAAASRRRRGWRRSLPPSARGASRAPGSRGRAARWRRCRPPCRSDAACVRRRRSSRDRSRAPARGGRSRRRPPAPRRRPFCDRTGPG